MYKYVPTSHYLHIDERQRRKVNPDRENIEHEKAEERKKTVEIHKGMKT